MASEHVMNEVITKAVAEATRLAIQTMVEAWAERTHDISEPKIGGPTMNQPTFDWNVEDKYSELKTFRLEVKNALSTYNTPQTDKLALVKNWLGRKGLQYLETLMTMEKETCNTLECLFETLKTSLSYSTMRQLNHFNLESYIGMMMKM